MSFDDAFRAAYRASVEKAPTPDGAALASHVRETAHRTKARRRFPKPPQCRAHIGVGITCACAAAACALVIIAPAVVPQFDELAAPLQSTEQTPAESTEPSHEAEQPAESADSLVPGLTIRAYAADGQDQTVPAWAQEMTHSWGEPSTDGSEPTLALFYPGGASGAGSDSLWPNDDGTVTRALFMPETFTVEGSNIQRVQIHVSAGELYLQSIDKEVSYDRQVGLELLDPRQRGSLAGYEDCDALSFYDWMDQDEEGHWRTKEDVFRMKRMGTVIDLDKGDDERVGTRDIQFGLLSMTAISQAEGNTLLYGGDSSDIEQPPCDFDGVQLTITATFDDGSCETQVIELHRDLVMADEDGAPLTPLRLVDEETALELANSSVSPVTYAHIAYGTLVSKTDEPFPYADEPANMYADQVMPPMPTHSK